MKRVVVTGLAIWSPFGRGLDLFWQALISGKSAQKTFDRFEFDPTGYRTNTAAAITEIGTESPDTDRIASDISRSVVIDLLRDAKIEAGDSYLEDGGLCVGSSQAGYWSLRDFMLSRHAGKTPILDPDFTPLFNANTAVEMAKTAGVRGPMAVVSTACASSTSAIGIGTQWIQQGRAACAIVGGYGYFSELTFSGFNILRILSRQECRPFDLNREGIMVGDGYALAFLEEEQSAIARGARIRASIVGHSSCNEAFHPTAPSPDGDAGFRVMWDALGNSESNLEIVDYINAHGTGTKANDASEIASIRKLTAIRGSDQPIAVSSTKGHHGHALGAAGAIEFVATALAIENQIVPPTVGLIEIDPAFDGMDVVSETRKQTIRIALSNSFAFGGNCACIALAAPGVDFE